MLFLLRLAVFCYFSVIPTSATGKMALDAKPARINCLTTETFTLNCTVEIPENRRLLLLMFIKITPKTRKVLASFKGNSSLDIGSPSPYVKYSGGIIGMGKVFLSGKWTVVTKDLAALYECYVKTRGSNGYVSAKRLRKYVKEEELNFEHLVSAIKRMQSVTQSLRREMAIDRATSYEYRDDICKRIDYLQGFLLKWLRDQQTRQKNSG